MDLGNLFKVVVYYLLIRGMTNLDNWDGVPMLRLLGSHDFTKLLYYINSQPWDNIELMSKFIVALTYR